MADRIPLIVNPSAEQIQELPNQDDLVLSGQLKLTGTALGSDAKAVITIRGTDSNLSQLNIACRNNADSADVPVAEFNVGANDVPSVTVPANGSFIGNGTIPLGGIIMWSGTGAATAVPTGFTLCDGNSGAAVNGITIPDLRDKFIVGANAVTGSDSEYPGVSMNQSGGSANAVLLSHTHSQTTSGTADDGGSHAPSGAASPPGTLNNISNVGIDNSGTTKTDGSVDGTNANLPPFFALAFIIRTS